MLPVPLRRPNVWKKGGRVRGKSAWGLQRRPFPRRVIQHGYPSGPMRVEYKNIDVGQTIATDTTGAVVLLNGCARGDDINNRIGRKTMMRSLQLTVVSLVTAGTGVDQFHRVLVVYDRQTNATALTGAQVLSTFGTTAFKNLENRSRFKILMDKTIHLNASNEPGSEKIWKKYFRFNLPVTYNSGDDGTVADITTGSLYCLIVGNKVAGATAGTTGLYSRIRYNDV